jgi:two-component system, OmpR family, sensor histidine kinase BaeS
MRFRLVFVLAFALVGAVSLTVLAMGGVTAWQLRSGFTTYLQQRDLERLDNFLIVVRQAVEREGGIEALRERRITMRNLMRELGQREGVLSADQPPREPLPDTGRPPPPGKGRPPAPAPETFPARVALFELDGRPLFARPMTETKSPIVERTVNVFGKPSLLIKFAPLDRLPEGEEASFLNSQYRSLATVAASLLSFALILAVLLGRRWAKSLHLVKQATAQIAQGEFTTRLAATPNNEIGDVMRDINQMADSLARMEADRRRWIADISHELRTPLAILRGEVDAMLEKVRPLNWSNLQSLSEEIQRLSGLVNDLHLLAMADLHALPCHFAEEDAIEIVQTVLNRLKPRLSDAGLDLKWVQPADAKLPVYWDSTRIQQVLVNLLENSLRYTDSPGSIHVTLAQAEERIYLEIADTAPGVPLEDLPKLFSPLYRSDAARTRTSGGSGLGMAICQAIIKSHGGNIEASSSSLGGLSVRVSLPMDASKVRPSKAGV